MTSLSLHCKLCKENLILTELVIWDAVKHKNKLFNNLAAQAAVCLVKKRRKPSNNNDFVIYDSK